MENIMTYMPNAVIKNKLLSFLDTSNTPITIYSLPAGVRRNGRIFKAIGLTDHEFALATKDIMARLEGKELRARIAFDNRNRYYAFRAQHHIGEGFRRFLP